ncbi:MAG: RHS repeat-associated core domain-containing protein [Candidatus Pseudomonas phytovorans]|uniref:RHS repeat-associated core domain-containing protein n=1 Tax=Candidatus Pseudomonas phytovorans TaxID=3121377 RepID=A0AAJ5WCP3_9PSED|nr:RHS repeat-associated core domain-containing protein [Pseudomonas sp.]WEK28434.1 MAG: RHS repeat-associated core domain-containing protein [Pseudomonas sp.]
MTTSSSNNLCSCPKGLLATYTAYGMNACSSGCNVLGYNGQPLDPWVEGYHLGQGRRLYSPARGTFCSPDPLSPFGKGGVNAYAYCGGDPVNFTDPTGLFRRWGHMRPPAYSPKRRASGPLKATPVRISRKRRDSLPSNWKDNEELPGFTEASRHIDQRQLDAVRYNPATQRDKVIPTYKQSKDPRGLAAQTFADDHFGRSAETSGIPAFLNIARRQPSTLKRWSVRVAAGVIGVGLVVGPILASQIRGGGQA